MILSPLWRQVWIISVMTVMVALGLGMALYFPLWEQWNPPFPMPQVDPVFMAPLDGPFYLANADQGYAWQTQTPESLWFHPLLAWIVRWRPSFFPAHTYFWLISLLCATLALVWTYELLLTIAPTPLPPWSLVLCVLAPGGVSIATGNAEIPTLVCTLGLLLAILKERSCLVILFFAVASILMKPNALYMIPTLSVYAVVGVVRRNYQLVVRTLLGIMGIMGGLFWWIETVHWQTGTPSAYWDARTLANAATSQNVSVFFYDLLSVWIDGSDLRNILRYSQAVLIPCVNFIIIGAISFNEERHRYAWAAANAAMLGICLYSGNPNKIIVYTTTLPYHFCMHSMAWAEIQWKPFPSYRGMIGLLYLLYCMSLLVFYSIGTALAWYF
jgi:hypothetical protein